MARYTERQWKTLLIIGAVYIAKGLYNSLPPPFYPQEAESKGATATEYGLVFGIYDLVSFVSSPILGKYMHFLGAVVVLRTGVIVAGISSVFFGLLHFVDLHATFIGLSFAVRILASLGSAALVTSSFSILTVVFPDGKATAGAAIEVHLGLGLIVGPTVGALLLNLGGYPTPFVTVGVLLLVVGWLIIYILPPLDDSNKGSKQQPQLWSFFRLTPVLLDSFAVGTNAIANGFYAATLEPHIRQFGLTTLSTGAVFIIAGVTYVVTALLVGRLCDKCVSPRTVIVVGAFLGMLSFALVGPLPYTGLSPTLWMCCLGLVLHGASNACLQVPAFIDGIRSAVEYGLPDDITTYGVISGLWASSLALGACVGSSVAGVLYDNVGFRVGTLFVIVIYLMLMLSMMTFICARRRAVQLSAIEKTIYESLPPQTVHSIN